MLVREDKMRETLVMSTSLPPLYATRNNSDGIGWRRRVGRRSGTGGVGGENELSCDGQMHKFVHGGPDIISQGHHTGRLSSKTDSMS
jgi:hypothetical protein